MPSATPSVVVVHNSLNEAKTTGTVTVVIAQSTIKDSSNRRPVCRRRSRRLRQIARLVLENPSIRHCPPALAEALKISYANARKLLYWYGKLTGNPANRLCPECLLIMRISNEGLVCTNCGCEYSIPRMIAHIDSLHEKQSGIWGTGTEMTLSELKQIAPSLKRVYYSKGERLRRAVISDLEQVLKYFTLSSDQTTYLAQRALYHFRIFANEKGRLRVFRSVLLTLFDGAIMNQKLSLGLLDYISNGPYYTKQKQKKSRQSK